MFKDGEQQVLDIYEDVLNELKENITIESATVETFGQEFKVIKNKDK